MNFPMIIRYSILIVSLNLGRDKTYYYWKLTYRNNVTVGAGAVVIKEIPDNGIIAGNPAKIIKITSIPEA